MFMDYYAEQSCTAGRNAFFTGMHPLRTGMIPPQLPGSPSYLRPGTPALAKFLLDLGYTTGEFGKNHLGDHTEALPTAHGFQEFWGYLYHLDAMQEVSFPDINKTPTEQGIAPPCKNTPIPGLPEVPGAVDPKTTTCLTPPRPVHLVQVLRRHGEEPDLQGRGPADAGALEDGGRGDLGQGHRLPRPQRPEEDQQAVLRLVQPGAHAHHDRAVAEVRWPWWASKGGKDWGVNEAGMKQMDDNIGYVLKKLEDMGQLDNTIVVFTTDNGAESDHLPRRRHHAVQGRKADHLGRRHARSAGRPLAGPHQAGHGQERDLRVARLAADAGRHRRRAQGRRAEEADRGGQVSRHRQDHARRRQPARLPRRQVGEVGARYLLLLLGRDAVGGALQELEDLLHDGAAAGTGGLVMALIPSTGPWSQNIKRDPFEQAVGDDAEVAAGLSAARSAAPSTAYIYDWNMLPIGQLLWEKELDVVQGVPAAAGAGDLQPRRDPGADEEGQLTRATSR